ncbi:MAG: citrate synthase [Myxococcales bacterium]|nr:citrate synthase [Myxococcales bacterium]MDH5566150.1 citrate synthase [Myxococcales bacterium]
MAPQEEYSGAVDLGLEGVVACSTSISAIAGTTLLYRGYTIEDLAEHASFEEVVHLLWHGRLPRRAELEQLQAQLGASVALPPEARVWLLGLPKRVHPMDFLHAVVAGLSLHDPDANVLTPEANLNKAMRLAARIGTIVAAYHRARSGLWPLEPAAKRSLAWNFLRGLDDREPSEQRVRDFDVCLVLHADHELNASAFSARVTSSTLSGIYSSVMSAIGTLKGPLHGGANEAVIRMLREIGSVDQVDAYLEESFARHGKVMGFGHRVYKEGDPRARILKRMSERLTQEAGSFALYEISERLEQRMAERKGLIPNVDFYSATVYDALGIPEDLFTPVFAMSRVAGWCAHILEQYADNRIYRPRGRYTGPHGLLVTPLEER